MMRAYVLVAIAASACQATDTFQWMVPAETASFVLALEDPRCEGGPTCEAARAYEGNTLDQPFSLPEGEYQLYLLTFPFGLAALDLEPGPLPSCQSPGESPNCQPGSPLPAARAIFAAQISGSEIGDFAPVLETSPAIRAILLPRRPAEACANQGRCFSDQTRICSECPEPNAALRPSPPVLPVPFEAFSFQCRPNWTAQAGICFPPEEELSKPSGACARGTAQRRDQATCTPIGAPCPSGQARFSPMTPPGAVYVDGNVATSGDGATPESAVKTIAEGIASTTGVISIATGTYVECFSTGSRILGACAEQTRIIASGCGGLELRGAAAQLENVAVDGAIIVYSGSIAAITGVDADNTASGDCISATDAELQVQSSIARNCMGSGLRVTGGTVLLSDFVSEDAEYGLRVEAASIEASAMAFRGGRYGFQALRGASGTFENLLVEGTGWYAVDFDGVNLGGRNILVRDTNSSGDNPGRAFGLGATMDADSRITLEEVVVERAANAGIAIRASAGRTSDVRLADVFMRDIRRSFESASFAFFGRGAVMATVSRMAIIDADDIAVTALDGAELELGGLVVRADQRRTKVGLIVQNAEAAVNDAIFSGMSEMGVQVTVRRLELENVRFEAIGEGGNPDVQDPPNAIFVSADSTLIARRVAMENIRGNGVALGSGSVDRTRARAQIHDLVISNLRAFSLSSQYQDGVALASAGDLTATRVSIHDVDQALAAAAGTAHIQDAVFQNAGVLQGVPSIHAFDAVLSMTRAQIRSPDRVLDSRDAEMTFVDVELAAPGTAIDFEVFRAIGGRLNFDRVVLDGRRSHGPGIGLCGLVAERLNDLTVHGFQQGAGMGVFAAQVEALTHFSFDDNFVGLIVSDFCFGNRLLPTVFNASDGLVRAQDAGMRVLSENWDVGDALLRVRYLATTPIQMARGEAR